MHIARGPARAEPRFLRAVSAPQLPDTGLTARRDGTLRPAGSASGAVGRCGELGLRKMLGRNRFDLHFQPIVRLTDRVLHHYEALLRPRPTAALGVPSPQEFVRYAEAAGLAPELDLAVFARALQAAAAAPTIAIGVNISGHSLQSPAFCDEIAALLAVSDIAADRLLLELTETAEIDDTEAARASLARLRDTGIRVCLDDLGAGAAAFRYLRDFPVDFVKIDGSYVRAALHGDRDRRLVAAMVALAHALGARVIAERVETEAEAEAMQQIGVDFGQGWLFGRPAPLPSAAACAS